jgi:hypothetical protein
VRKTLLISLMLLVTGSSFYIPPAQLPLPKDCVFCGHVCCCPEICAKKKSEWDRDHAQCQRAIKGCDQPISVCQVTQSPTGNLRLEKEEGLQAVPKFFVDLKLPDNHVFQTGISSADADVPRISPQQDIPTPPPRLNA